MSTSPLIVLGHVLEQGTNSRLEGVVVRLSGWTGSTWQVLAGEVSGSDGAFRLTTTATAIGASRYQLTFSQAGRRLVVSSGVTEWSASQPPVDFVYRLTPAVAPELIDDPSFTAPTGGQGAVRGVVKHQDGSTLASLKVRIFTRGIAGATQLAEVTTQSNGTYQHEYTLPNPAPNIYVQVWSADGSTRLVASPLVFSVPLIHRVDLTLKTEAQQQAPEYGRTHAIIDPILTTNSVTIGSLDAESVLVLTEQSRLPMLQVQSYIIARKLDLKLTPNSEELYALVRQGLPTNPSRLVALNPGVIVRTIQRAIRDNQVSPTLSSTATTIADNLRADAVTMTADDTVPRSLGALLKLGTTLSTDHIEKFVQMWFDHTGSTADFWTDLDTDTNAPQFSTSQVSDAKRAIQLGIITLNHPPMVSAFEGSTFGSGAVSRVVELSESDWTTLMAVQVNSEDVSVPPGIQGDDETEKRANYATILKKQAQTAFPSPLLRTKVNVTEWGAPEFLWADDKDVLRGIRCPKVPDPIAVDSPPSANVKPS